jgi:hypothetical protein
LFENTSSFFAAFKAHTVYQLCLMWNEYGNKYANFYDRFQFLINNNYEKRYQYMPAKTLQLYQQNKDLIRKYPILNNVLDLMAQQILKSGLRVEMEDKFMPGEAIPIKAIYKNTNNLFYRIVHVNPGEPVKNKNGQAAEILLSRKSVTEGRFILPLPDDHNNHAVFLKLPALEKTRYCLLFSDKDFNAKGGVINSIAFQVTNIAVINTDERVYVLDRKTGQPLMGANILPYTVENKLAMATGVRVKVNKVGKAGYVIIPEYKTDSIAAIYQGDTLRQRFTAHMNSSITDDIYDKDVYDDLGDFYDDKLTMQIFTDRSIYRPGQTVHYKIIFLTKDPYTGATILFNRQNLGGGPFKNRLNKWFKENKELIALTDAFNRKVDSAKITINEFGSFAGSFALSKAAATGTWRIDGSPKLDYRNSGEFQVEEYKRPTIELSMEKQKKMLRPGEPFVIKLKLRSFSGADLNDIQISYSLNCNAQRPHSGYGYDYKNVKLLDSTAYTDKNGELLISVNDTALSRYGFSDKDVLNYNYSLHADAIDATGEKSTIDERINISSRPVKININADKIYDRQAIPALNVSTIADFEGTVGRPVAIKLYQVSDPDASQPAKKEVDQWYYQESEWNKWFPKSDETTDRAKKERTLVLDTIINTGSYQKLTLSKQILNVGFYELTAVCEDDHKIIGQSTYNFSVFDSASGKVPVDDIDYLPVNAVKPGETITWYSSGKNDVYTIYEVLFEAGDKHKTIKNIYHELNEKSGLRRWSYRIPADATGKLLITRVSVLNNTIAQHQKTIYLVKTANEPPEIIVEKYRKIMAPGAQETFTVSVKTRNEDVAAELMTTMYDASLDKLQEHHWNLPDPGYDHVDLRTYWDYSLTSLMSVGDYGQNEPQATLKEIGAGSGFMFSRQLEGRAYGVTVNEASGLNEVVVVGYGTQRKLDITGSAITVNIRGIGSINEYKQPLIVLDGAVYTGDLKDISATSINQIMVLKGADASVIYGSRANEGVLIISTKGPIVLPGSEEPVIKIRKNFNETAFFFPQVHVSADGYYHFSFTMPETTTEWNWKILAHTRNAQFAYLEKKLQTQMNLMVQPNMPRLLYQGDQIKLQSRISNLDTTEVSGKTTCRVEDAVTGQDITAALIANATQNFKLSRKNSGAVSFSMTVPAEQTNPVKIVITASSGKASDAEEHIIPILSSKVFTRQSVQVHFKSNASITIPAIKLPADAALFGIGISIGQKPQASLINALPWLANYSYDCAEQTFNKLRARATALRLMQKDTIAQAAFKRASLSTEKDKPKEEALPDGLAAESMPWLSVGNQASHQQKQLFNLLDTITTLNDINKRLEKLYKLQQPDGGLAWFDKGESNPYISAYVLAGFGQLKKLGWRPAGNFLTRQQEFIRKLNKYIEDQLMLEKEISSLYQVYAISYWRNPEDAPLALTEKINLFLAAAWQDADKQDLEQQALVIINTFRYLKNDDALYKKAQQQIENLKQLAIIDADNGLRWKDIADAEELGDSAEETLALIAEAFDLSAKYNDVDPGIIKWLLTTKQDQHWQTTKATAAVIDLLQKQKGSTFGETKAFATDLAGQHLSVSDGLLDGMPAAFVATKQLPESIILNQQGKETNGALTWYYFAEPKKVDTLNKAIKINKQFYCYNKENGWVELTANTILKPGDEVHVKLTIETAARLKFVHISDPRSAAFEPKENISGYQYGKGLGYYQSIKDTGLELFAESVPRGISEINYVLVVSMSGQFTSGPARLQCMYQPWVTAYSTIQKIKTN